MKDDVAANPGDVGFFGAAAIVARAECLANAVEQTGFAYAGRRGLADRR
jgi:hypothetical protein